MTGKPGASGEPGAGAVSGTGMVFQRVSDGIAIANTGIMTGYILVGTGSARYRLEAFRPAAARDTPDDWLMVQPSRLLDARAQVVPFTGRAAELADLEHWRDVTGALSVRLLHGAGGQGKTRLSMRFAELSVEAGWTVLAARHDAELSPPATEAEPATPRAHPEPASPRADAARCAPPAHAEQPSGHTGGPPELPAAHGEAPGTHMDQSGVERAGRVVGKGLLVLVDYADRWPHSQLVRLLRDPTLSTGAPTRVLLLGRSVQWWSAVRGELTAVRAEADERALGPLAGTVPARDDLFRTAWKRFADLLGAGPLTPPQAPATLREASYDTVLTVHMAALVAAYAGGAAPDRPEALAAYLLDREQMSWRQLYDAGAPFLTPPRVMSRAVFAATLTGALSHVAGRAALRGTGLDSVQQILDDHRLCYPPTDRGRVLEPLYPDRLAEDFLALLLPGHDNPGYDPDPWAADALAALLARGGDGGLAAHTPRSVTFLAASAGRWPHVAGVLASLLTADPALAVDSGGTALTAIAEVPGLGAEVLTRVERRFPDGPHMDLAGGMAAVTARRIRLQLAAAGSEDEWAARLIDPDLGYRLILAGRYREAATALTDALPWWRRLAGGYPEENLHHLGLALSHLSIALRMTGRGAEAVAAAEEGVAVTRRARQVGPRQDDAAVAAALVNLGTALSDRHQIAAALAATGEAVLLYRQAGPAAPLDALASALCNQAQLLGQADRPQEALAACDAGVGYWRQLAEASFATHGPGLAGALNNQAGLLATAGRGPEALAAVREATTLYRRLAEANAALFEGDLASALSNLNKHLAEAGQLDSAAEAATEAVDLRRRLAAEGDTGHEAALGAALVGLSSALARLACHRPALAACEEAVAILRRAAATDPGPHEPVLASALHNLGSRLMATGDPAAAVRATEEAADLRRTLVAGYPAQRVELADNLRDLTRHLTATGQRPRALAASEQEVHLRLALAAEDPARHEADLADAFIGLSVALADAGRVPEAAGTTQTAALLYRRLVDRDRARYASRLAHAHANLSTLLTRAGAAPADLYSATCEAARDLRRLSAADPTFEPDLAMTLAKLGVCCAGTGRLPEAVVTMEEAVRLRRRLAASDPLTHEPHLARLLYGNCTALAACGIELPRAVAWARESQQLYVRLLRRAPDAYAEEWRRAGPALARVVAAGR
ncbi:tetratricopeptide repeat protein [Longispora sp. K20-0274]|uniref:tetratricopeptide repeat protein n=1 Tax=Longispora sp. K20-0274 TaxID=3088255 RepID=UPI00399999C5